MTSPSRTTGTTQSWHTEPAKIVASFPVVYVAALPTASSSYRGGWVVVQGNGSSTADQVYTCLLSATGTYSWKSVATG